MEYWETYQWRPEHYVPAPRPKKTSWTLFYRDKPILENQPYRYCRAKMNALILSGAYYKELLTIK